MLRLPLSHSGRNIQGRDGGRGYAVVPNHRVIGILVDDDIGSGRSATLIAESKTLEELIEPRFTAVEAAHIVRLLQKCGRR